MAWILLDENNRYTPGSLHLFGKNTIIVSLANQSPTPGFISNFVLFNGPQKSLLPPRRFSDPLVNVYPTKYFSFYITFYYNNLFLLGQCSIADYDYPQSIGIPSIFCPGLDDDQGLSDFYFSGAGIYTCLLRWQSQMWRYNETVGLEQIINSVLDNLDIANIKKIAFSDGNDRSALHSLSSAKGYYILMNDGKVWFLNEPITQLDIIDSPYNSGIDDISWSSYAGIVAVKRFVGPPPYSNVYIVNYASNNHMELLLEPPVVDRQNFYLSDICQNFNGDFYGIVGSDWQNFYTGQLVYWQNENIDVSVLKYKAQDSSWRAEFVANPTEMINSLGMTTDGLTIDVKELSIGKAKIPNKLTIVLDPIFTNDTIQVKKNSSRDTFSGDYEFDFQEGGVRFRCTRALLNEIMRHVPTVADRIIGNLNQDTINSFLGLFALPDRPSINIDDFIRRLLHQVQYDHQCYLERLAINGHHQGPGDGGGSSDDHQLTYDGIEIVAVDTVFFRYFGDPENYNANVLYEIYLSNGYLGSFIRNINSTLAFTLSHILYSYYPRIGSL